MNSNVVSPIPKVYEIERITDFCPITIVNFCFKIITKILADKLTMIASMIISPNQNALIKERGRLYLYCF